MGSLRRDPLHKHLQRMGWPRRDRPHKGLQRKGSLHRRWPHTDWPRKGQRRTYQQRRGRKSRRDWQMPPGGWEQNNQWPRHRSRPRTDLPHKDLQRRD